MPAAEVQQKREAMEDRDTEPPSPDLSKYNFHIPSRKSSREKTVPNIVIPSADICGSETPSPLSPITPPDRLSPIEELDDNASLRSHRASKHAQFETSSQQQSRNPQARPESNDFELQATLETGDVPLEARTDLLFSQRHLELIFADKELSARFGTFLRTYRPDSVPILGYYLDTIKALRTLKYAEAVVKNLERIPGLEFTAESKGVTMTWVLEDKADRALDILTKNDLPAFIAYIYVSIVDLALVERVTGKADMQDTDVAIGLAEVFTISDPSRPDNPLVFASDEFHRMTQYPSNKALGRNCRFLGGPRTDPNAISRFKSSLDAEREHCEVLLNYRRDGSPFINLVMVVPLRDQNGRVRYYLGAQLDITELVNTCTGLESLRRLVDRQLLGADQNGQDDVKPCIDQMAEFQQLSETFTSSELQSLLKSQERQQLDDQVKEGMGSYQAQSARYKNSSLNLNSSIQFQGFGSAPPLGFYRNYLLVRPHPSLRILFASPDLRVPGILQSPLMDQIGGSPRVRGDLYHALESGQKVTAKVQWLSKTSQDGHARWIHCTPLISATGLIGVWMVILVDDDEEPSASDEPAQPEVLSSKTGPNDASAPSRWETAKADPNQSIDCSPSTANSSQTAFSDPAKPIFEKVPTVAKEIPEIVNLPFASTKMRASNVGISTTDLKPNAQATAEDWIEPKLPRQSTDSNSGKRQSPNRPRFGQSADNTQAFIVRAGPRIAGKTYSFDSHSEHGISPDDDRNSNRSRVSSRPTSQESNITSIKTNIQPPDIRWRKIENQSLPIRGGRAPIKLPGRPMQEIERPPVRKTKKSLSPYGFLFND